MWRWKGQCDHRWPRWRRMFSSSAEMSVIDRLLEGDPA